MFSLAYDYSSISSDNGLAPNRQQAIIWTNDGIVYWRTYASLSLDGLRSLNIMGR